MLHITPLAMDVELIREYCLAKNDVTESFPFDDTTLVFKIGGKMFALLSLEGDLSISLKCVPELAMELREQYACVKPAYHMNKAHWNTIFMDGSVSKQTLFSWIDHSYRKVIEGLPLQARKKLKDNEI